MARRVVTRIPAHPSLSPRSRGVSRFYWYFLLCPVCTLCGTVRYAPRAVCRPFFFLGRVRRQGGPLSFRAEPSPRGLGFTWYPPGQPSFLYRSRSRATANIPMASGATDDTGSNTISKPSWNMSPNTFPSYLMQLRRWLPHKDPRYNDLVERGVALDRGKVCCSHPIPCSPGEPLTTW